jgi:ankyrin repeat protein
MTPFPLPRRAVLSALLAAAVLPSAARAGLFESKTSRLASAVEMGRLDEVKKLVDAGADVNGTCKEYKYSDPVPLIDVAAKQGGFEVFRYLVEHGAKLEARGELGKLPIHYAAEAGQVEVVKYLVERRDGAGQLRLRDTVGRTPLHYAAYGGQPAVVTYLLDHGADIEAQDSSGETPLYTGSFLQTAGIDALIERGANLKTATRGGSTPLHNAADWGHADVVRDLLGRGLSFDARDNDGRTPLHRAAMQGRIEVVQEFVEWGADPAVVDSGGKTPADIVCTGYYYFPAKSCPRDAVLSALQSVTPVKALGLMIGRGIYHPRPPHDIVWGEGPKLQLPENVAKEMSERGFDNVAGLTSRSVRADFETYVGSAPVAPPPLVQDRYESRTDFQQRVEAAKRSYEGVLAAYDKKRRSYPAERELAYLEPIFLAVFGRPKVDKTEYDPDGQVFSATVVSDSPYAKDFRETFLLKDPVPNAQAAAFEKGLQGAGVAVRFRSSGGSLSIADAVFTVNGSTRAALPAQGASASVARMQVDLSSLGRGADSAPAPELSIKYAESPELAEKVKELDALRKKRAEQSEIAALQAKIDEMRGQGGAAAIHSDVDDAPAAAAERDDDLALVVGIENYHDKDLPSAAYAERDADAAAAHFAALGVPRRNLKVLKGSDATRAELEGELEWLARNSKPGSRVYFFFSGHGAPDPKTGAAYVMPWDGNPAYLDKSGLPLGKLYESLGKVQGRVLVALDSCFSGAGGRSVIQRGTRPLVNVALPDGLPENVSVLAASRGEEVTGSLDDKGHGAFTYYLLKGLQSGAKDAAGLCRYLRPLVQDAAARQNRTQTPVCSGAAFELP